MTNRDDYHAGDAGPGDAEAGDAWAGDDWVVARNRVGEY
jgi:hypothetical protein